MEAKGNSKKKLLSAVSEMKFDIRESTLYGTNTENAERNIKIRLEN